jgi:hypothetical protein
MSNKKQYLCRMKNGVGHWGIDKGFSKLGEAEGVNGTNVVHNAANFGNFLGGAAGQAMGFDWRTLSAAAHAFTILNPNNGYGKRELDSKNNQLSILLGYSYAKQNRYHKK